MSPRAITPFRRGRVYWARVPRLEPGAVQRSLGTTDRGVATEICRFLEWLRGRRESWLLEQLAAGRADIGPAFDAYADKRLDAFIAELRHGVQDVDVEPYVARWIKELARRGKPNAQQRGTYERQVRTLVTAPFPRTRFTKQVIREWLLGLDVGQPNRYRAALSSFAEYLVFEDVIPGNPVRQVPMARERQPRTLHITPGDALRLVDALEQPHKALSALMVSMGMEVSAALSVRRRDVNLDAGTVYARGTKRATRERTCHLTDAWRPVWSRFAEYVTEGHFLPDAPLFPGVRADVALRVLRRALKAVKLPEDYRQHDHRHTWAVQAIRDGLALHTIAYQLGHSNAVMVLKVYGRYQPHRSDFGVNTTSSATAPMRKEAK